MHLKAGFEQHRRYARDGGHSPRRDRPEAGAYDLGGRIPRPRGSAQGCLSMADASPGVTSAGSAAPLRRRIRRRNRIVGVRGVAIVAGRRNVVFCCRDFGCERDVERLV